MKSLRGLMPILATVVFLGVTGCSSEEANQQKLIDEINREVACELPFRSEDKRLYAEFEVKVRQYQAGEISEDEYESWKVNNRAQRDKNEADMKRRCS